MTDRGAVVTGGAQGIGLAVARKLLSSGEAVSIWDQDEAAMAAAKRELEQLGPVHMQTVDIADRSRVLEATENTEHWRPIAILVHCAGMTGPDVLLQDCPIETWQRVMDVNLTGMFHVNQAIVRKMINRNYGRIVNVSSIAALEGPARTAVYAAAKAAVISLSRSLGKETAQHNIAVNCVTPAATRTRLFDQLSQQTIDFMLSKIARRRFSTVDEVAAFIQWLVSEENSFVTGENFNIAGARL